MQSFFRYHDLNIDKGNVYLGFLAQCPTSKLDSGLFLQKNQQILVKSLSRFLSWSKKVAFLTI